MPSADWVTRFSADDPTNTVEKFKAGYSVSGMAVDSQGNVWIANRLGSSIARRGCLGGNAGGAKLHGNPDPVLTQHHGQAEVRLLGGRQRHRACVPMAASCRSRPSAATDWPAHGRWPWMATTMSGSPTLPATSSELWNCAVPIPRRGRPAKRWAMRFRRPAAMWAAACRCRWTLTLTRPGMSG